MQVGAGDSAHLGFESVIEPGGFEQFGGAGHHHGAVPSDRAVPESAGQLGLADSRAQDQGAMRAVDEAERGASVPRRRS